MALKQSDKVICIAVGGWQQYWVVFGKLIKKPWKVGGPVKDKMYKVTRTGTWIPQNEPMIEVEGFIDQWYSESSFRKVDESFAEAVLEKAKEEIKELQIDIQHEDLRESVEAIFKGIFEIIFNSNKQ